MRNEEMQRPTKTGRPPKQAGEARTSTLTIRLTPKMRFGLEMMARLYHISIPDIVSRAVNEVFGSEYQGLSDFDGDPQVAQGYRDLLKLLWSERPSDRVANIALHCHKLLSGPEMQIWHRIRSDEKYWSNPAALTEVNLLRDVLAADWESLQEVVA
jgi:hypothetical protein